MTVKVLDRSTSPHALGRECIARSNSEAADLPTRIALQNTRTAFYGFILHIASCLLLLLFLIWGMLPEDGLRDFGILYYPQRYCLFLLLIFQTLGSDHSSVLVYDARVCIYRPHLVNDVHNSTILLAHDSHRLLLSSHDHFGSQRIRHKHPPPA